MLSKANAKVKLFCGVHSEALVISFTDFEVLSDFRFNPNQAIEKLLVIK